MTFIISPKQMDDVLADAIWWLKGFSASRGKKANADIVDLEAGLRSARQQINRLARGKSRLIGHDENDIAIAITEREFDVISDAFMERATPDEIRAAFELIVGVRKEYVAELRAFKWGEAVPF